MIDLKQIRNYVNEQLGELSSINRQLKDEQNESVSIATQINDLIQAQSIAQAIAQSIQQRAHDQIAGVVSSCLKSVFGPEYGFKIYFEQKRNRTEARLVLIKGDMEINDPLESDSGGVVEVAAFALRIACITLSKPKVRRVLILDEPFKSVHSPEYRDKVRQMLEKLSYEFDMQIIMVTGVEEYKTGTVVQF